MTASSAESASRSRATLNAGAPAAVALLAYTADVAHITNASTASATPTVQAAFISLCSRLVAVCDAYDAMTDDACRYQAACSPDVALDCLRADPAITTPMLSPR